MQNLLGSVFTGVGAFARLGGAGFTPAPPLGGVVCPYDPTLPLFRRVATIPRTP
jgi:hypothetical protein